MDQPTLNIVDLVTLTRARLADMQRQIAEQFPGTVVLGCVVMRNRLGMYCCDARPPREDDLRALLTAAQSVASALGQEILIDVVSATPPAVGDA